MEIFKMKKVILLVSLGVLLLFAPACRRQSVKHYSEGTSVDRNMENAEDLNFTGEPSLRWEHSKDANLKIIYFDFDKSALTIGSIENLRENADYLKKNPRMKVVIEGHTDNRGTTEYNLSLGQRRSMKVKEYYVQFGVEGDRIATISYGKENPIELENNELAWSKNRRAETRVLSRNQNK
jgi:peptidoglycan-associated lipoprotein